MILLGCLSVQSFSVFLDCLFAFKTVPFEDHLWLRKRKNVTWYDQVNTEVAPVRQCSSRSKNCWMLRVLSSGALLWWSSHDLSCLNSYLFLSSEWNILCRIFLVDLPNDHLALGQELLWTKNGNQHDFLLMSDLIFFDPAISTHCSGTCFLGRT